ncbi:Stp1/IreP family PP2C-type Ser/Thr phosphatase [Bacillus sp. SCS-151]|uniref:Stp1/IreP family PP2C-type Ser/Thr phosphatase n=1 Tax=Nanhaiella sioensis TaxID=3115293 RepID=UPI00397A0310
MNSVFLTDKGKVRPHNEDNGGIFKNQHGDLLVIVADGMGGHRAGDVASEMTSNQLRDFWENNERINTPEEAEKWMMEHVVKVNEALFKHAHDNPHCNGMGTTLVVALCTSNFTTVGHIGDSRCYLLNDTGFSQLTEDHSLVNELVRSGQITKEDAEHHPRKNVLLRALGTEEDIKLDIKTIILEEDDILLLCSDGLSNKISEDEFTSTLQSDLSLSEKAHAFIDLANEHGGEDNITLSIIEYTSEYESR